MGVSGVGKTTIGKFLAKELNVPFFDGDDYHSQENIAKMSQGTPLNDNDRAGWLLSLNELAKAQVVNNSCVIVCSALKQSYRDVLSLGVRDNCEWVYLYGTFDQIMDRMKTRKNHFMPSNLLSSQFDVIEVPKNAIAIDCSLMPKTIVNKVKNVLGNKSEFGMLGLGVMGKSLSRNLAQKGFKISIFNREVKGIEEDVAVNFKQTYKEFETAQAFSNLKAFVDSLQTPRTIMLMVNAGKITDRVIEDLIPLLSERDILIDGGNSNYLETKARYEYLKAKNIHFIGVGVSGGEQGALLGPSIMPGGDKTIYQLVKPYLEGIAAKDANNLPCCSYVGEEGSGHFVKMVHNGIEYVEMQLLAEIFSVLNRKGKNPDEIADILESWKTEANSYLLGITVDILRKKEGNDWLINKIVDKAGNKGTGNWATIAASELGVASTMIASALFARYTSFYKEDRIAASQIFKGGVSVFNFEIEDVRKAYQFARIINHHQGFKLILEASKTYNWNLNLSEIARIWTNGCIIKSDLMIELITVLKEDDTILSHKLIIEKIKAFKPYIKQIVSECILNDLNVSCLSESISFLNAYATAESSANLIQAQRDYFGAHSYQRTDDVSGKFYHTNWIITT